MIAQTLRPLPPPGRIAQRRFCSLALWVGLAPFMSAAAAYAADLRMPRSDEATDVLSPVREADIRPRWQEADSRTAAAWGDVLVWPQVGAGLMLDSNPFQDHRPRRADGGVKLQAKVFAEHDSGPHTTTFYGDGGARLYARETGADAIGGRLGVLHDWFVTRDIIVRAQADLSRSNDRIDNRRLVTGQGRGDPFQINDLTGSLSAQKSFERLFVSGSGSVLRESFDDSAPKTSGSARGLSDQTVSTAKWRTGYLLGPAVFVFAEPALNWRALDRSDLRSDGKRVMAGLGTFGVGLLSGELFAGYQRQVYHRASSTAVSEPVYGGRITWSPTPAWKVSARFDRQLAQAAVATVAEPIGTPIKVQRSALALRYTLDPRWTALSEFEDVSVDYVATRRHDRLLSWNAVIVFACWRKHGSHGRPPADAGRVDDSASLLFPSRGDPQRELPVLMRPQAIRSPHGPARLARSGDA